MQVDRSPKAGWRVELASQVESLESLLGWSVSEAGIDGGDPRIEAVESHLRAARSLLRHRGGGSRAPVVVAHLDGARTSLLRIAPAEYVFAALPDLVMRARRALTADDSRLMALEVVAHVARSEDLTLDNRQVVVACALAIDDEGRQDRLRLDNFKSIVLWATQLLTILALVVAFWGWYRPQVFPICFVNEAEALVVCPSAVSSLPPGASNSADVDDVAADSLTSADVAFLLFLGVIGAALSTALTTRNLRSGVTPRGLWVSLSLLKIATGSLTALFGIVIIRAGLVPGIEGLDTRSEIIAWALVFGFSQQLFTGVIDRRTQSVLEQTAAPSPQVR